MDKKLHLIAWAIFLAFAFGHFYQLNQQEFIGDEAARFYYSISVVSRPAAGGV